MKFNSFSPNVWVMYKFTKGPIKFICDKYITVCINSDKPKSSQTNILIHREDWSQVTLIKESEK